MKPPGPDAAGAGRSVASPRRKRPAREGSRDASRIVGVVLAGGKGRRLRTAKAALRLPGSRSGEPGPTLVNWSIARLYAVHGIEEILVAAGDFAVDVGSAERGRRVSTAPDGPGSGPAAGVLGAARSRPGRRLLVLACDLPLVPVDLLADLAASDADLAPAATNVRDPRSMNPTCALWAPPALDRLAARIERGDNRLHPLTRCAALRIEPVDAGRFGDPEDVLLNVNTAADWERARRLVKRESARRGPSAGG